MFDVSEPCKTYVLNKRYRENHEYTVEEVLQALDDLSGMVRRDFGIEVCITRPGRIDRRLDTK